MSSYGDQPPHDPDAQGAGGTPPPPPPSGANPYGAPPPPAYGQPPAYGGASPYGAPGGYGPPAGYGGPRPPYAHWGKRAGAFLIDGLLLLLAALPLWIGYGVLIATVEPITTTTNPDGTFSTSGGGGGSPAGFALILVGVLTYLAFLVWNVFIKQGRTGYTIGKGVLGIRLLREADGQPIGAGMAFVRQICHVLDSLCYIGYLWPLWDAKRQTFADKIMNSIVVDSPKT